MDRIAIYIDGGYLNKVLQYNFNNARIDFEKLSQKMAGDVGLLRTYYYHCLPYQSSTPTDEERGRYASMHAFTTSLSSLPRFDVRLGKLAFRGVDKDSGKPIFVQKRVDLLLGLDMALLAVKGRITHVALLSGDSDIIPSVEVVKKEGVLITLWHGALTGNTGPSRELMAICDEHRLITKKLINAIRRPRTSGH